MAGASGTVFEFIRDGVNGGDKQSQNADQSSLA